MQQKSDFNESRRTCFLRRISATGAPLGLSGTNDIRGIKAPVELPDPWFWIWLSLGLMVLAAAAWWVWRKWRAAKSEILPEVVVPPHDRAREKLRAALALIGQPRPFCVAVSDTIRVYLEERFQLHAPERTTEEFLEELRFSSMLALDQKQTLGEFLQRCDLVKFARYEPAESELRQLYEAAVRLVDETEPAHSSLQETLSPRPSPTQPHQA